MSTDQPTTPGARIALVHTTDEHTRLQPYSTGTVMHVDDAGTVHVLWDDGTRLGLIPGEDVWRSLHPRWDAGRMVQTFPATDAAPTDAEETDR